MKRVLCLLLGHNTNGPWSEVIDRQAFGPRVIRATMHVPTCSRCGGAR